MSIKFVNILPSGLDLAFDHYLPPFILPIKLLFSIRPILYCVLPYVVICYMYVYVI